jgi:hypothetical protein
VHDDSACQGPIQGANASGRSWVSNPSVARSLQFAFG